MSEERITVEDQFAQTLVELAQLPPGLLARLKELLEKERES